MDKFGLINLFTKIAQDKNAQNLLSSAFNSLISNKGEKINDNSVKTQKPYKNNKPKYSQEAILNVLKRHDEISKNIDRNEKNKPPKI